LIAGLVFFFIGLVEFFSSDSDSKSRDLAFIIVGTLLLIPGFYYSMKLVQVYLSKNPDEKNMIISEFPIDIE
jgi:hypothetical protein